jgi:hypothetical protein
MLDLLCTHVEHAGALIAGRSSQQIIISRERHIQDGIPMRSEVEKWRAKARRLVLGGL